MNTHWITTHRTPIIATTLGVTLTAGVALVATNTHLGRMAIDETAADIADTTINTDTVDYYTQVCTLIDDITTTTTNFVLTTSDTIGETNPEALTTAWHNATDTTTTRLTDLATQATHIDENAPTIPLANGDTLTYTGALTPIITTLNSAPDRMATITHDPRLTSDNPTDIGTAATDAINLVTTISSDATTALGDVYENAPVATNATMEAINTTPACHTITGGAFAGDNQDTTIQPIVDLNTTITQSHDTLAEALWKVNNTQHLGAAANTQAVDTLRTVWQHVADAADTYHHNLTNWTPEATSAARTGAAQHAADTINLSEGITTTATIATTAHQIVDTINTTPVDGLADAMGTYSDAITEANIAENKWANTALITMPIPTTPTADTIKRINTRTTGETNPTQVDEYTAAITTWKPIDTALQHLGEAAGTIEGMTIDQAAQALTPPIADLAAATSTCPATSVIDPSALANACQALNQWATTAETQLAGATTPDDITTIFDTLDRARTPISQWLFTVLTTGTYNQPTRADINTRLADL